METIATDAIVDVPVEVCVCPYCGGKLYARFSMWTENDDKTWSCYSVELDCESEPELDEDDPESLSLWDDWFAGHSQMPYVYWLPACLKVQDWVNERYRFAV